MSIPSIRSEHWHMHDENGDCWGDYPRFQEAALSAARHNYDCRLHDILVVIEAPFCIDVCRADQED